MTGDVGGERNVASGHVADDAKVAVYQMDGVQVLPPLAIAGRCYYWQKVRERASWYRSTMSCIGFSHLM